MESKQTVEIFVPSPFGQTSTDGAEKWLAKFELNSRMRILTENAMTAMFGLLMKGPAQIWHSILPGATRNS